MRYTNADIVPAALRGENAQSGGHFSTDHYAGRPRAWGAPYLGYLPTRLRNVLDERFRAGAIDQVVYSYSTPIAWRDSGKWIIPDVRYSATTSSRHQSQLWHLPNAERIPYDTSLEEYLRVVAGLMVFRVGRTFPASAVA